MGEMDFNLHKNVYSHQQEKKNLSVYEFLTTSRLEKLTELITGHNTHLMKLEFTHILLCFIPLVSQEVILEVEVELFNKKSAQNWRNTHLNS